MNDTEESDDHPQLTEIIRVYASTFLTIWLGYTLCELGI